MVSLGNLIAARVGPPAHCCLRGLLTLIFRSYEVISSCKLQHAGLQVLSVSLRGQWHTTVCMQGECDTLILLDL